MLEFLPIGQPPGSGKGMGRVSASTDVRPPVLTHVVAWALGVAWLSYNGQPTESGPWLKPQESLGVVTASIAWVLLAPASVVVGLRLVRSGRARAAAVVAALFSILFVWPCAIDVGLGNGTPRIAYPFDLGNDLLLWTLGQGAVVGIYLFRARGPVRRGSPGS